MSALDVSQVGLSRCRFGCVLVRAYVLAACGWWSARRGDPFLGSFDRAGGGWVACWA